ncbi:phage tail assembly protein [Kaustia mangrovi]|uniref:Phage tail assembly protein n=1 Tax=Kaustia mangrovi TaxID=2593653 RepID=A0A7S8HDH1_9HYPH|nr:phage tail assembly protein [Kaustia mangrovi]QPC44640.1 phage tail assembly protein [Kaustia mangrovi]
MAKGTDYTLLHPKEIGGHKITTVTLRRPTGKDIRAVGSVTRLENTDFLVKQVADLSGLPLETIDELDGEDVLNLIEKVSVFFGGSQARTSTS